MGLFSSGKKYKRRAEDALRKAALVQDYQSEQEFRRNLLANIRQERIARAQLELGNYSADYSSSSAAGAIANIDSSLAGETYFSYASSDRAQQIQNYNAYAQNQFKKYAKQQKKRATAFAVTGAVVGAVTGGALGAAGMIGSMGAGAGALVGSQVGQGIGQVTSNTGTQQTMQGVQNIIGGAANAYRFGELAKAVNIYNTAKGLSGFELSSVNPVTNQVIPGTTIDAGSYYTLVKLGQTGLRA